MPGNWRSTYTHQTSSPRTGYSQLPHCQCRLLSTLSDIIIYQILPSMPIALHHTHSRYKLWSSELQGTCFPLLCLWGICFLPSPPRTVNTTTHITGILQMVNRLITLPQNHPNLPIQNSPNIYCQGYYLAAAIKRPSIKPRFLFQSVTTASYSIKSVNIILKAINTY